MAALDEDGHRNWRRPGQGFTLPWPNRSFDPGVSTFGAPMSRVDEHAVDELLERTVARAGLSVENRASLWTRIARDEELALASRRWHRNAEGHLVHDPVALCPGDVLGIRSTMVGALDRQRPSTTRGPGPLDADAQATEHQTSLLTTVVYGASPYWLEQTDAWAAMASRPLSDDDRGELRLSSPAMVLFSSGMEISEPYLGLDILLVDRIKYQNEFVDFDPEGPSNREEDYPPTRLRSGTFGLLKYWSTINGLNEAVSQPLFTHELAGILLCPDEHGGLGQFVGWLLRRLNVVDGATTKTIVTDRMTFSSGAEYSIVEGDLDKSLLRPIAEAVAAMVCWGDWSEPPALAPTPEGKEFRKWVRTSAFKRAENRGDVAGVRVVDVRRSGGAVRYREETDRSVRTHFRRGHWRRVRVGPRDNWTYRRQRIRPVVVNAGVDPIDDLVLVYRIPPPAPARSSADEALDGDEQDGEIDGDDAESAGKGDGG